MLIAQVGAVNFMLITKVILTLRVAGVWTLAPLLIVINLAASIAAGKTTADSCSAFSHSGMPSSTSRALSMGDAAKFDRWAQSIHPVRRASGFDPSAYVLRVADEAINALDPGGFLFLQNERTAFKAAALAGRSDLLNDLDINNGFVHGAVARLQELARTAVVKCRTLLLDPDLKFRVENLVSKSLWSSPLPNDEAMRSDVFDLFVASIARKQMNERYAFADSYRFALRHTAQELNKHNEITSPDALPTLVLQAKLKALDHHSKYTPRTTDDFGKAEEGMLYAGIGALVTAGPQGAYIHLPLPGSAAKRAGLLPGDGFLQIDGEDVTDADASEVARRLRGKANVPVLIRLRRGNRILDIEVMRSEDQRITEVTSTDRLINGQKIVIIKIDKFSDSSALAALVKLDAKRARASAIVLNLMDNPGGKLAAAVAILSQYLPPGLPTVELIGHEPESFRTGNQGRKHYELPLVVLINDQSASAAEVVAGALKAYGRAVIVGTRSFGKGTYQKPPGTDVLDGTLINGSINVTGGYFHLPDGRSPQLRGVTPDIEIASASGGGRRDREADADSPLPAPLDVAPAYDLNPIPIATLDSLRALSAARQAASRTDSKRDDEAAAVAEAAAIAADMAARN